MNEDTLRSFTQTNKKLGLRTALAGALKFEDIEALKRINPDIIGVRGMVCGGDRNATIREDLIKTALAHDQVIYVYEKLDVPLSLTFDDVLLEPQASWLNLQKQTHARNFRKKSI